MEQEYLLAWNDHHSSIISSMAELASGDILTDVSVWAGETMYSAHRLVLALSSHYFRLVVTGVSGEGKHPVIFLKDVNSRDFERLLQYMYRGEVSVPQAELVSLIAAAKSLGIRGLAEGNAFSDLEEPRSPPPLSSSLPQVSSAVQGPTPSSSSSVPVPPAPSSPPALQLSIPEQLQDSESTLNLSTKRRRLSEENPLSSNTKKMDNSGLQESAESETSTGGSSNHKQDGERQRKRAHSGGSERGGGTIRPKMKENIENIKSLEKDSSSRSSQDALEKIHIKEEADDDSTNSVKQRFQQFNRDEMAPDRLRSPVRLIRRPLLFSHISAATLPPPPLHPSLQAPISSARTTPSVHSSLTASSGSLKIKGASSMLSLSNSSIQVHKRNTGTCHFCGRSFMKNKQLMNHVCPMRPPTKS